MSVPDPAVWTYRQSSAELDAAEKKLCHCLTMPPEGTGSEGLFTDSLPVSSTAAIYSQESRLCVGTCSEPGLASASVDLSFLLPYGETHAPVTVSCVRCVLSCSVWAVGTR